MSNAHKPIDNSPPYLNYTATLSEKTIRRKQSHLNNATNSSEIFLLLLAISNMN